MFKIQIFILFLFLPFVLKAQQTVVVDRIAAVVGGSVILQSDIENQYLQLVAQHTKMKDDARCAILEDLLVQKLLLNQAKIDSVEVSEENVEQQLDQRMKYFIDQLGSQEKLEKYFNKSVFDIKDEMRDLIREQMITNKMQSSILSDLKITPTEVKDYYKSLDKDSIPLVNSMVEIAQVVLYPAYSANAIYEAKQKLLNLRKRIMDGEKFSTLAILYSEDPGTARNGGEVGYMSKGELDPEYAKVAFSLKENGISTIVESQFGYHIIQLIGRKDDRVNTRHILIKPKATEKEIRDAMTRLDSIANAIKSDSLKFSEAALNFSEDKNSRLNHGMVINPHNNSSKFELDELNPADYYAVKNLKVNEISKPFESVDENGKQVFKIIKLVSRTDPHRATLKDDYQLIEEQALMAKRKTALKQWISDKQKTTFIHLDDSFKNCDFEDKGWIK